MLYDDKRWTMPEIAPDLGHPSPGGLIYLLKHRELWPWDHTWNYRDPNCCAVGLARRRWPELQKYVGLRTYGMRRHLGFSYFQFMFAFDRFWCLWRSPEKVAKDIEKQMVR